MALDALDVLTGLFVRLRAGDQIVSADFLSCFIH